MKNFLQVNRALAAEKNFYLNLNQLLTKLSSRLKTDGTSAECGCLWERISNHTLITQLSPNNHPINLPAIRYVATLLVVLMVGFGQAWGAETVLFSSFANSTASNYFKSYTVDGKTVTVATSGSISSSSGDYYCGAMGSTPSNNDGNYVELSVTNAAIKTVSVLITGNGSNKTCQPALLGWEGAIASNTTADYVLVPASQVISDKGVANAQWHQFDVHGNDLTKVRIYRAVKGVNVAGESTSTTTYGNAQSLQFYGIRVELEVKGVTFSPATGSSLVRSSGTVALTSTGNTVYYKWSQTNNQYASGAGATLASAADGSGTSPVNTTAPSTTGTWYLYTVAYDGAAYSKVNKATYTITNPTHTLTWNLDGGTASGGTAAGAVAEGATLTSPTVYKAGYDFAGWSPAVPATMPSSDATYIATWTKVYASGLYTFENYATVGESPSKTVTTTRTTYTAFRIDKMFFSAMDIEYESDTYGGEGDDFKGWKIKTSGATIKFFVANDCDVTIGVGTLSSGATITYTNQSGTVKENQSLTAKQDNTYSVKGGTMVTFKTSGGSTVTLKKIQIGSSCTTPTASWSTAPANGTAGGSMDATLTTNYATGAVYTSSNTSVATVSGDETGTCTINYVGVGTARITATVTGDGSTYCSTSTSCYTDITVGKPTRYKVTYKANGGTGDDVVREYLSGTTVYVAPNYMFSNSGYIFTGWNTKDDGSGTHFDYYTNDGSYYHQTLTLTKDTVLFAKWKVAETTNSDTRYCLNEWNSSHGTNVKTYFTQKIGDKDEFIINYDVPDKDASNNWPMCWVGKNNSWYNDKLGSNNNSKSANLIVADMSIKSQRSRKVGLAPGAIGTVHINDRSGDDNLYICFLPKAFGIVIGSTPLASSASGIAFYSSEREQEWITDVMELTSDMKSGYYYVGFLKSDGNYVKSAADGRTTVSVETTMSTMGIYSYATSNWSEDHVSDMSVGSYGAFRLWSNNNAFNNFACHWVPYYGLKYNANGGSGAPAVTGVAQEGNAAQRTINISTTEPTYSGYHFEGWAISSSRASAGTVDYEAGDAITLADDVELFAVWSCITPDAPTADKITVTPGCAGTGATFSANTTGVPSYVTWYWQTAADGTSTSNAASSDYTTATSAGSYTMYLRAKNTACGEWSASGDTPSKSVKVKTPVTASWSTAPANGTADGNMNASLTTNYGSGVVYTSSDPSVATVSGNGTKTCAISYVAAGTARITATVTGSGDDYCSTASCYTDITVVEPSYSVTYDGDNCTKKTGGTTATRYTNFTATFQANTHYTLPSTITVTIGGSTATAGTHYTWSVSAGVGTVTIGGDYITGAVVITVDGVADQFDVTLDYDGDEVSKKTGSTGTDAATYGTDYVATFQAKSGYTLQSDVTVTIGESTATKGSEYTWVISEGVGTLTITGSDITDDITVTVGADADVTTYSVTYAAGVTLTSGDVPDEVTGLDEGDEVTVAGNTGSMVYSGYTFRGWTDGTTFYLAGQTFEMPADDVTLTAVWDGGSGSCYEWAGTPNAWTEGSMTADSKLILTSSSPTDKTKIDSAEVYKDSGKKTYIKLGGNGAYVEGHISDGSAITGLTIHAANNKGTANNDFYYMVLFCSSSSFSTGVTGKKYVTPSYKDEYNASKLEHEIDVPLGTTYFRLYRQLNADVGDFDYDASGNDQGDSQTKMVYYIEACTGAGGSNYKVQFANMTGFEGTTTLPSNIVGVPSGKKVLQPSNPSSDGYTFGGWYVDASCTSSFSWSGTITKDTTLYAKWTASCSAPAAPTISGTNSYTTGNTITLTATCASGTDASTTYTWYKGADWSTARAASPVQASATGSAGYTFTKASCTADDAGTYWCEAANSTCTSHNAAGYAVAVPLGRHTLTWNLTLTENASTITTGTKVSTSSHLTTLTDVAKTEGISYGSNGKTNATPSITSFASSSAGDGGDGSKYVYVTFTVASGYQFTPISANVSTTAISDAKNVVVTVGSNTKTREQSKSSSSTPSSYTYTFPAPTSACTGTVTMKIYAYGATSGIRLGTPITLTGIVESTDDVEPTCSNLDYVWKTGSIKDPFGNSHTYASTDTASIINANSATKHITISGTNVAQTKGSSGSLNIAKANGNYFLLTASSGYTIDSVYFYGKIEDGYCQSTTANNTSWAAFGDGSTGEKAYAVAVGTQYFGIKNKNVDSPKGVWIRTMRVKVCSDDVKYTVTYNANGHGSAPSATTNISPGSTISAPSAPSAECWTFGGWFKEAACVNAWTFASDVVTDNITLYAKWTSNRARVKSTTYGETDYTVTAEGTADAITVTPVSSTGVTYKWYSNTSDDVTGWSEIPSAETASYSPSIASVGTTYYWAVLAHECGNDTTSSVRINVAASKTDPTIAWGTVQLGGASATPTYGGGGYTLTGTINSGNAYTPTLTTDMITASEGIVITSKSVTDAGKTFSLTFDVTAAFDTTQANITNIHFELPGNATYNDSVFSTNLSYDKCSGGGVSTDVYVVGYTNATGTSVSSAANKALKVASTWRTTASPTFTDRTSSDGFTISATNANYYWKQSNQTIISTTTGATMRMYKVGKKSCTIEWTNSSLSFSKVRIIGSNESSDPSTVTVSNGTEEKTFTFAGGKQGELQIQEVSMEFVYGSKKGVRLKGDGAKEISAIIELVPTGSDGAGTGTATTLQWKSGKAPSDDSGWNSTTKKIDKAQSDANFTCVAEQTSATNSVGAITYASNNTEVATVNATTGEVDIVAGTAGGEATITATMARSGCFMRSTISYTISVAELECDVEPGTLSASKTTKCTEETITLTLSDYTSSGTTISWFKVGTAEALTDDGVTYDIDGATLTTAQTGTYYAKVTLTARSCALSSNNVTIKNSSAAVSVTPLVSKWYIKKGRKTPDIALWQLGEGCSLVANSAKVDGDDLDDQLGGCTVFERDGIIYLSGDDPSGISSADTVALTVEVEDACGNSDETGEISIIKQMPTDKHELAFVVTGTNYKEKTFDENAWTAGVKASESSALALYQLLKDTFKIQATNIYASDDEKKLREYYSQYDLICITDYPNTKTKGKNSKSYVDAIGSLIDIRPVLTMEAWVSGLDNWRNKGVVGERTTPSKRQYNMLLQCKDHEIFEGTKLVQIGYGDDALYKINMVDSTEHRYVDLDATSKSSHASDTAALQGFTTGDMKDLLPLGLIDNGSGTNLQVGAERQRVMAARMLVLGINSYAMERLTEDGQRVVVNALQYLCKKNPEDISDCSSYFVGTAGDGDWGNADNWLSGTVPTSNQEARIIAPVTISDIRKIASVKIVSSGTFRGEDANGSLTIAPTGTLVVADRIQRAVGPDVLNGYATNASEIMVEASSSSQGALVFNNEDGKTKATVQMYSKAGYDNDGVTQNFAYIGIPVSGISIGTAFPGADVWIYDEDNAYWWTPIGSSSSADARMKTYCISHWANQTFEMAGTLAPTGTQEISLGVHSGVGGDNMIANSWTAPIDIAQFETSDFDGAAATLYMYRTGHDEERGVGEEGDGAGKWVSVSVDAAKSYVWPSENRMIPSMQAFDVVVSGSHTLTLDYDRLVRSNAYSYENGEGNAAILAPKRRTVATEKVDPRDVEALRLMVNGKTTGYEVYLFAHPNFTDEFDNGWDARHMEGGELTNPLLCVPSAIGNLDIAAIDEMDGRELTFVPSNDREYTFSMVYEGGKVLYLNDLKLQQSTLLQTGNTYSFTWENGDSVNRFMISGVSFGAPGTATGIDETQSEAKAQKIIYNDKLFIIVGGHIYSAEGVMMK